MFYYIMGKIALKTDNFAVIDCGGVGYKIFASKNTLDELGSVGETGKLYTLLNFKSASDIMDLYGFSTLEEKNLFEMITSVSRVGAKTAISLLSNMSPSKFALCVVTNDFKYIAQKTPGLGAKGAQRIVLELKDKFKGIDIGTIDADEVIPLPGADEDNEAVSALMVLGYSAAEAKEAIKGATGSVEEIVKIGLKNLMRG
ncbi:MAG: Holliday junction branch migration protein RuvA [Clostridia bacterium]|nr:Holliday junction branch migration protein RuvA [Clostridia bacterium]